MAIIKKGQEKINLTVTLTKKQTILMTRNKSKKASAIDNSNMVLHSFIQKLLRISCIVGNAAKSSVPFLCPQYSIEAFENCINFL